MFGIKGRKTPAKNGLSKSLKVNLASGYGNLNTCPDSLGNSVSESKILSSDAYLLSKKRMSEVEAEKALMVNVSRHPRWVAGGPH